MKKKTKAKKKIKKKTKSTSPNFLLAHSLVDDLNDAKLDKAVHYLRCLRGPKE